MKRVYSLICNLHNLGAFYGLFKTEIAQKYPIISGIGSDHVFLCEMAREGKIIYCPRSTFIYRETKLGLNHDQVVESWKHQKNSKKETSYEEMKREQLRALKDCKPIGWEIFFKRKIVKKAAKKLQKRFGK